MTFSCGRKKYPLKTPASCPQVIFNTSSSEGFRYNEAGKQSRKDLYDSTFDPNLYAKLSPGACIMKLHFLRRKIWVVWFFFSPKYYFQEDPLHCKWLLPARLALIYLAVLTPRVWHPVRHIPTPNPASGWHTFQPLPLVQKRFCWSDCSRRLGLIAP